MGFKIIESKGGDFEPVPAGSYIGRAFQLIDLGTQTQETGQYAGKSARKIRVVFEVFGDDETGQPLLDPSGKPFTISKDWTNSSHEKGNLRKDMASWRGKAFADDEFLAFDITKLVGAYAMVNVTHTTNAKGKTYANISGLSPLPSALKNAKPAPVYANGIFDIENPDMQMFDGFYEYLQETIKKAPEWNRKHSADDAFSDDTEMAFGEA